MQRYLLAASTSYKSNELIKWGGNREDVRCFVESVVTQAKGSNLAKNDCMIISSVLNIERKAFKNVIFVFRQRHPVPEEQIRDRFWSIS